PMPPRPISRINSKSPSLRVDEPAGALSPIVALQGPIVLNHGDFSRGVAGWVPAGSTQTDYRLFGQSGFLGARPDCRKYGCGCRGNYGTGIAGDGSELE